MDEGFILKTCLAVCLKGMKDRKGAAGKSRMMLLVGVHSRKSCSFTFIPSMSFEMNYFVLLVSCD